MIARGPGRNFETRYDGFNLSHAEKEGEMGPTKKPRERILDAADELFYTRGIHAVGIDEIVARSGTAKTTLYAHFPSKDDLVASYLQRRSDDWRRHVDDELAAAAARRWSGSTPSSTCWDGAATRRVPRLPVHQRGGGVPGPGAPGAGGGGHAPPVGA